MKAMSVSDLCDRWLYTRQGVHNLTKSRGFPPPLFVVSRGRMPVWYTPDIERWEVTHPEVYDPGVKVRKQRGFFRAKLKGAQAQTSSPEMTR